MLKVEVKQPSMVASHCWLYGSVHDCKTKATRLHTLELVPSFQIGVYSPSYNGSCGWLAQCMHSAVAYQAGYIRCGYPALMPTV